MSWTSRISARAAAIAIVALVAVGAGGALAHGKIAHLLGLNSRQVKQVKAILKAQSRTLTVAMAANATAAVTATSAATATSATTATTAVNATNATNASELDGETSSGFEPAADVIRTGLVSTHMGVSPTPSNTVSFTSFGPFTLTLTCTNSGGNTWPRLNATSTVANSVVDGSLQTTAGATDYSFITMNASSAFADQTSDVDFLTPSGSDYQAIISLQENYVSSGVCSANAVIMQSS